MLNPYLKIDKLNHNEYERYSRHLILDKINKEGQERIKSAKILFIGAGGINASSLIYLTASGIGLIGIIDNDKVDISNLQRQIIYNINDIKKDKVKAAKNNLQLINPLITIKTYNYLFSESNAYDLIADYDIVIDGTDNYKSRYTISRYCYLLHKIHIYGAVDKFIGQVSIFNYQNGPNYNDLYDESSHNKNANCNARGILNTIPATVGIIQATEAIKIVTGIGKIMNGYLLRYNALNLSLQMINIKPIKLSNKTTEKQNDKNSNPFKPEYIQKKDLKNLFSHSYYLLIDIREPIEFKLQHINYAINIPLRDLKKIKTIQNLVKKYATKIFIIYCNNELRSYIASKILTLHKVKHFILKGGMKFIN